MVGTRCCHSADTGDGRDSGRRARASHFRSAAAAFLCFAHRVRAGPRPGPFPALDDRALVADRPAVERAPEASRGCRRRTVPGPRASSPTRAGSGREGASSASGGLSAAAATRRPPRFLHGCGLSAFASRPLSLTFTKRFGWTLHPTGVRSCQAKRLGFSR
jgi:hypothetical protein